MFYKLTNGGVLINEGLDLVFQLLYGIFDHWGFNKRRERLIFFGFGLIT